MQISLPPIIDSDLLFKALGDYKDPKAKAARMIRAGDLVRLKKALYIQKTALEAGYPRGRIANALYGPSYLSFESALRLYGLIPEAVENLSSATFHKRRSKVFHTEICSFVYRDVPARPFPFGIAYRREGAWGYLVAMPEKALCDIVYIRSGLRTRASMREFLFEDLRIDDRDLRTMDARLLEAIAAAYQNGPVALLASVIEGIVHG